MVMNEFCSSLNRQISATFSFYAYLQGKTGTTRSRCEINDFTRALKQCSIFG